MMKKVNEIVWTTKYFDADFEARGVNNADSDITIPLKEVRCGVVGPMGASLSYYYVMMGRRPGENPAGKEPLIFVSEFESEFEGVFFRRLRDDVLRMKCSTIYGRHTQHSAKSGFYRMLWKELRGSNIRIRPAPCADDIPFGKTIIREWFRDEALQIPKYRDTILKSGLREIDDETGNESPAFHALRFVLAGFIQDPLRRRSSSMGGSGRERWGAWV